MARSTLSDLITRTRVLIADDWVLRQDSATGDGSTKTYWLTHKPLKSTGGTVSVGGTVQGTALYTLDRAHGRLEFTSAPASAATVAVEYHAAEFTDDQVQEALDRRRVEVFEEELISIEDTVYNAGGSVRWLEYRSHRREYESTDGGTAVFVIEDTSGSVLPSSGYTPDYTRGIVTFAADQGGSARYLTGRCFDLYGAAAELLESWAAREKLSYNFHTDGQVFQRVQKAQMLMALAQDYRAKSWPVTIQTIRGDAH